LHPDKDSVVPHRLRAFISSTGDLKDERDAVECVLKGMDVDGERFETWPSTPNHPIEECLRRVKESDAFILLLGKRYGTPAKYGSATDPKSGTHWEFEYVVQMHPKPPVFVFVLEEPVREPEQVKFIDLVRSKYSCCRPISTIHELQKQVRLSVQEEFVRCFRQVHSAPPTNPSKIASADAATRFKPPKLEADPDRALEQLSTLYRQRQDLSIQKMAEEYEARFKAVPEVINLLFVAQVNLAMQGLQKVAPGKRVSEHHPRLSVPERHSPLLRRGGEGEGGAEPFLPAISAQARAHSGIGVQVGQGEEFVTGLFDAVFYS
jgi:hypothetical protein